VVAGEFKLQRELLAGCGLGVVRLVLGDEGLSSIFIRGGLVETLSLVRLAAGAATGDKGIRGL
jgi:hypothetical protein